MPLPRTVGAPAGFRAMSATITPPRSFSSAALVEEATGVERRHLVQYSFDPLVTKGNCENFLGVAQVPIGLAGPLLIDGEHA
jgi:hydroxymethylglutaryl-CoA reductase